MIIQYIGMIGYPITVLVSLYFVMGWFFNSATSKKICDLTLPAFYVHQYYTSTTTLMLVWDYFSYDEKWNTLTYQFMGYWFLIVVLAYFLVFAAWYRNTYILKVPNNET